MAEHGDDSKTWALRAPSSRHGRAHDRCSQGAHAERRVTPQTPRPRGLGGPSVHYPLYFTHTASSPPGPHNCRTRPARGPPSGPSARSGHLRPRTPAATAAGLAGCRSTRSASVFLTSPPLRAAEVRKTPAPQNNTQPGKIPKQRSNKDQKTRSRSKRPARRVQDRGPGPGDRVGPRVSRLRFVSRRAMMPHRTRAAASCPLA